MGALPHPVAHVDCDVVSATFAKEALRRLHWASAVIQLLGFAKVCGIAPPFWTGVVAQVSPTFHFDLDRISFGVVSYGFLNSKTLTLTNTSEASSLFSTLEAAEAMRHVEYAVLLAARCPCDLLSEFLAMAETRSAS